MGYDWLSYYKSKQKKNGVTGKKKPVNTPKGDGADTTIQKCLLPDTVTPKISTDLPEFINCVGQDFKKYIASNKELCKVRKLFDEGENPDYNDINVQQLYLLRFAYAYAFENKEMYSWILKDRKNSKNLSVESIGCGCLVDSWALQYAAETLGMPTNTIKYKGIDLVHWSYQLGILQNEFLRINAADYFNAIPSLDSEVYIFPRSIGDFSEKDFQRICNAFSQKKIAKDILYILISHRKGTIKISDQDINRTNQLREVLEGRHYICTKEMNKDKSMKHGLSHYDSYFGNYPPEYLTLLEQLKGECDCNGSKKWCKYDCKLGMQPMFYTERLSFSGFKFERK